jgi:hypothetical protein
MHFRQRRRGRMPKVEGTKGERAQCRRAASEPDDAMPSTPPRALIYMTGRNCERYVRAAIESVAAQTHAATQLLFVDDCSDDGTAAAAQAALLAHLPGRHGFVRNPQRWGKARNAHVHLRAALDSGDFVAILDADDQLIRPTVLAEMAQEYAAGHDVVWTNFVTDRGHAGSSGPLDPLQSPRTQGWRTSHFFSFRAELFANVPAAYLQDDAGQWFAAACDRAIALPILDQTRRYKFLPVHALRYTTGNPNSHHNRDPQGSAFSSREQTACAGQIQARAPLPCTRPALVDGVVPREATHDPRADAGAAASAWSQAAASVLAQRCPALVGMMMDDGDAALPVADAWRLWSWLQATGRPPRVLELGAGPLAAPVQAMVQALGGACVSVASDAARVQALQRRLAGAGVAGDARHSPAVEASLGGHAGRMPRLSALPAEASRFDVLLVSPAHVGASPIDAVLALPAAVDRLDPAGFRVCVWAPEDAALRSGLARVWSELAPALTFDDAALGGNALCAQPGTDA